MLPVVLVFNCEFLFVFRCFRLTCVGFAGINAVRFSGFW